MGIDDWNIYICAEVIDPRKVLTQDQYDVLMGKSPGDNPMTGLDADRLCNMKFTEVEELQARIKSWNDRRSVSLDDLYCNGHKICEMPNARNHKLYLIFACVTANLSLDINYTMLRHYEAACEQIDLGPLRVRVEYTGLNWVD